MPVETITRPTGTRTGEDDARRAWTTPDFEEFALPPEVTMYVGTAAPEPIST